MCVSVSVCGGAQLPVFVSKDRSINQSAWAVSVARLIDHYSAALQLEPASVPLVALAPSAERHEPHHRIAEAHYLPFIGTVRHMQYTHTHTLVTNHNNTISGTRARNRAKPIRTEQDETEQNSATERLTKAANRKPPKKGPMVADSGCIYRFIYCCTVSTLPPVTHWLSVTPRQFVQSSAIV